MLPRIAASQEQIDKIIEKHLNEVFNISFKPNGKTTGYVWCSSHPKGLNHGEATYYGLPILQWRLWDSRPMHFSLQIKDMSYDVNEPKGELYNRLKEIGLKAREDFWNGAEI